MKIVTKHNPNQELTVTVEYPQMNDTVVKLISRIKICNLRISCNNDGEILTVDIDKIYYIESVDRKSFVYTDKDVYRCELKLHEIEEIFKDTNIVRINKACLINIDNLYSIKQVMNSQLEAIMLNGEKLIVGRTYLKSIKNILKGEKR